MATIVINGNSYTGNNISVVNGKVVVDGLDVTPEQKQITISVDGDVDELSVDSCNKVTISGSCAKVRTTSGSVDCGIVHGDVNSTSGSIECKNVQGDVTTTSGRVKAAMVMGNVRTNSGNVDYLKIGDDASFLSFVARNSPELIEAYLATAQGA